MEAWDATAYGSYLELHTYLCTLSIVLDEQWLREKCVEANRVHCASLPEWDERFHHV